MFKDLDVKRVAIFTYAFVSPEFMTLRGEYFIYEFFGVIGNVGGILGVFIGFSFFGMVEAGFKNAKLFLAKMMPSKKQPPNPQKAKIVPKSEKRPEPQQEIEEKAKGMPSKKRPSNPQKAEIAPKSEKRPEPEQETKEKAKGNRILLIKTTLNWMLFLFLTILAIALSLDTLGTYFLKRTSMSSENVPIAEHPSITLCFGDQTVSPWDRKMYRLGTDFNITYYINET